MLSGERERRIELNILYDTRCFYLIYVEMEVKEVYLHALTILHLVNENNLGHFFKFQETKNLI